MKLFNKNEKTKFRPQWGGVLLILLMLGGVGMGKDYKPGAFYYKLSQGMKRTCKNIKQQAKFEWTQERATEFRGLPIDTLLFDPYFLGDTYKRIKEPYTKGSPGGLYPKNAELIIELFEQKRSKPESLNWAVFYEPTGCGKTEKAAICTWLTVFFNITLWPSPQEFLGLRKGSKVCCVLMNKNADKSKEVTFDSLLPLFANSPFFQDYFPPSVRPEDLEQTRRKPSNIRFPKQFYVFPGSGITASDLGFTVIGYTMDEVNRWDVIERSVKARAGFEFDAADNAITEAETRMTNRWEKLGYWPGMIVCIGSANYAGDILHQLAINPKPKSFVNSGTYWDIMPKGVFGDEHFLFDTDKMEVVRSDVVCSSCPKEKLIVLGNYENSSRMLYCLTCRTKIPIRGVA